MPDPPDATKPPLPDVLQWNTKQKQVPSVQRHAETTPAPESKNLQTVAQKFKTQCNRPGHYPSTRLKEVVWSLEQYLNGPSKGSLDLLGASVAKWRNTDPKEYTNVGGRDLSDAVDRLRFASDTTGAQSLEDGDILFRYVPRGIDQRGAMQSVISDGQQKLQTKQKEWMSLYREAGKDENLLKAVFDTSKGGQSADLIQHVGIYVQEELFEGVVEIGMWGVYGNSMEDHGVNLLDLVVRPENKGVAERIGDIAYKAKINNTGIKPYPFAFNDFRFLLRHETLGGVMSAHKLLAVEDAGRACKASDAYKLSQILTCSHFVHAILWSAVDPAVTIKAATDKKFDSSFKISPSQLWGMFLKHQGIWETKLRARCVGIQQDGNLYTLEEKDLRNLRVAA